jgi:hypothetical protein
MALTINVDLVILIGGFILQLIGVAVAAIKIIDANNRQYVDMEVRNAERHTRLATKMERVEIDIQTLFKSTDRFERRYDEDKRQGV